MARHDAKQPPRPCAQCAGVMVPATRLYCPGCARDRQVQRRRAYDRGVRKGTGGNGREPSHYGEALFDAEGVQIPVENPGRCIECGTRLNRYNRGGECGPCVEARKREHLRALRFRGAA